MNINLVTKSLEQVQTKAKVNCMDLKEVVYFQNKVKPMAKELIKLGMDIEFYYCYGAKNKGWGANSTSINCTFNKDGSFKKVKPRRVNSKYTMSYIKIWGYSKLSTLEKNLIKKHFHCDNFGEITI